MIRKVRTKFILIAMTAIIICTTVIVATINLVNYYNVDHDLTQIVTSIADNGGRIPFPGVKPEDNYGFKDEVKQQEMPAPPEAGFGQGALDTRRNPFFGFRDEMSYETRFFIANQMEDGQIQVELTRMATLSEEDAESIATEILTKGKTVGYYDDYKYAIKDMPDGGHILVVMDVESRMSAVRKLAVISIGTALSGILVMFVFIAFFSKKAIAPVIESSEKQKQFITDASHELKTPLTVIATNMDVLSMDLGKNEWVDGTKKQVANLRKLVNNLVSLSRLEEENAPVISEQFDLSKAVQEAAEPFIGMAEFEGKTFTTDIEPEVHIKGDEAAIRQLVGIFCDNAVKYAKEEGEIRLDLHHKGKKVKLDFSNDCSEKVEEETLRRLFERFYRADASRTKDGKKTGYGIGLAIAKAIVEKQGGKVTVKQDENLKIHFCVTF